MGHYRALLRLASSNFDLLKLEPRHLAVAVAPTAQYRPSSRRRCRSKARAPEVTAEHPGLPPCEICTESSHMELRRVEDREGV